MNKNHATERKKKVVGSPERFQQKKTGQNHRPVKRLRRRRRWSAKRKICIVAVVGLSVLIFTSWLPQYQKNQEMKQRIADLELKKTEMQLDNQQLQQELDWLATDTAVERLAREKLGLIKSGEEVLLKVSGN